MILFREVDASICATSVYNHVISLEGRQNSPPGQKGEVAHPVTCVLTCWMPWLPCLDVGWQVICNDRKYFHMKGWVRALILASYWTNVGKAWFSIPVLAVIDYRQDLRIHLSKVVTSLSSCSSHYIWWNILKWNLKFRWRDNTHLII